MPDAPRYVFNVPPQRDPLEEAAALLQAGKLEECLARCEDIERRNPGQPPVAEIRGLALLGSARADEAVQWLERALAGNPRNPQACFNLVAAYVELGRHDMARECVARCLAGGKADPRLATLRLLLDSTPFFPNVGMQGWHAPERQVYMSAAIHRLRQGEGRLRLLELGSYMGASLLTWGDAVARLTRREATLTCVDAWDDGDVTQYAGNATMSGSLRNGASRRMFDRAASFAPPQVEVVAIQSFTEPALRGMQGPFDLIYIDACHLYDEAKADVQLSMPLVAEGGFLCGDDLELQLHQVDAAAARAKARIDYVVDPRTGQHFHPGVTLAVGELLGPVTVYRGFWIMQKRDGRFVPADLSGATGLVPRHWPEERYGEIRENIAVDGVLARLV